MNSESENPYQAPDELKPVVATMTCLACGKECERGIIHALGNISWYPHMEDFKMVRKERLSHKALNLETKLPAFKCPQCQTITFKVRPD